MRDAWPDLVSHIVPARQDSRQRPHAAWLKVAIHRYVTHLQRAADHVVTTTASFAEVLQARGVAHVSVIRNGTIPERYEVLSTAVRQGSGLRALYMGTVGRSQGLEVVVKAALSLREEGVPIELRIVGHGKDVSRLRQMATGSGVEVIPAVAKNEVAQHYDWADTTIVSLRDWAPFTWTVPSKLYELLAVGKHITAIVAGEAKGIVELTQAGVVVPPGNVTALMNEWRRLARTRSDLEISRKGRAWIRENADYPALARSYRTIFRSLTDRPRS
nr:glycosyltransferase [Microbacterium sp.]